MHEVGILKQVVDTVERIANENAVGRIGEITLEIGELSGVLPEFMDNLFPLVIEKNPMFQDAKLRLIRIPGEGLCNECESLFNIMEFEGKCPACGSRDKTILGGTEFILKNFTVLDED